MADEPRDDRPADPGQPPARPSGPFEPVTPAGAAPAAPAPAADPAAGAGRAEPPDSAEAADPADHADAFAASRRPTIEQPRPVDLYHRARDLRERLYGTAAALDDDLPPPAPAHRIAPGAAVPGEAPKSPARAEDEAAAVTPAATAPDAPVRADRSSPRDGEPQAPAGDRPARGPAPGTGAARRPVVPDLVPGRPLPVPRAAEDHGGRAGGPADVTGPAGAAEEVTESFEMPAVALAEVPAAAPASADEDERPGAHDARAHDVRAHDVRAHDTGAHDTGSRDPGGEPGGMSPRRRLAAAFWPPRFSRGQLVAGVLLFALGAGLAIQVRTTNSSDPLRGARESDLVRVLGELGDHTRRLEDERHRLQTDRDQLRNSSDQAEAAREQSEARANALGILAGTVKATGPGIVLTINDPDNRVRGDTLLDALQELRAAGAEVVQINQVRVVAGTWLAGAEGQVEVDGQRLTAPYVFKVIGDPQNLQPALNIPGGVIRTLEKLQAQAVVTASQQVVVDALRVPDKPDYARTAPGGDRS